MPQQTVCKQGIAVGDAPVEVGMPDSARLVRLEVEPTDPGVVWSWWYVPKPGNGRVRRVQVTGTGQPVPDAWVYLGSCAPHPRTGLVWHLWEVHDA